MRTLFIKNFVCLWLLAWATLFVLVEILPRCSALMTVSTLAGIAGLSQGAYRRYARYFLDSMAKLPSAGRGRPLYYAGAVSIGGISVIFGSALGWIPILATLSEDEAASMNRLFALWWGLPSMSVLLPVGVILMVAAESLEIFHDRT